MTQVAPKVQDDMLPSRVLPSGSSNILNSAAAIKNNPEVKLDIVRVGALSKEGSVSGLVSKWTKRKTEVKPRKHYRRGTIVLAHLEKKMDVEPTQRDAKLYEQLKKAYESQNISAKTMLGISVFNDGEDAVNDPFVVNSMPLDIQIGFRRKLYALFTLQLIASTTIMAIITFEPTISAKMHESFYWNYGNLALTLLGTLLTLAILYLTKYAYPMNLIALVIFTLCQSLFFSAVGFFFGTTITVFISSCFVFLMSMISIMTTRASLPASNDEDPKLMKHMRAGMIAFILMFTKALLFHAIFRVYSTELIFAALGFILVLTLWFTYDASCICQKMSPDEYMQGVIFFYTDMVLFLIFLSVIATTFLVCEGDSGCVGGEVMSADIGVADAGLSGVGGDGTGVAYAMSRADGAVIRSSDIREAAQNR